MKKSRGINSRCLFKKKDRIKNKSELQETIFKGRRFKCQYMEFYFRKNKKNRLGIIVKTKKNNSVYRNRIKRKIRECYRITEKGERYDLLIKIKEKNIQTKYKELSKNIKKSILKIEKILKSE